jgi:hypothetical protein
MERIYKACGRVLDDHARAAVAACIESNPKGQFGSHGYRLADYRLKAGDIRERFADYTACYDIPAGAGQV